MASYWQRIALAIVVAASGVAQQWQTLLPPRCESGQLVFDSMRGRTVFFGTEREFDAADPADFTWEFDGAAWRPIVTAHVPTDALKAATFDSARGRIVALAASGTPGVWEFDGVDWQRVVTAHGPVNRHLPSIAYDAVRQVTVLFDGNNFGGSPTETWEYDGVDWRRVPMPVSPPARDGGVLVHDFGRGRTVLVGGARVGIGPALTDTWEFDGVLWQAVQTATPPPNVRELHWLPQFASVAGWRGNELWKYDGVDWLLVAQTAHSAFQGFTCFDLLRQRFVHQVGRVVSGSGAKENETWEWDGFAWHDVIAQPTASSAPGMAIGAVAMATDLAGSRCLWSDNVSTWLRDATGWTRLGNSPGEFDFRVVHDAARGRFVRIATPGYDSPALVYELLGANWQLAATAHAPLLRSGFGAVFDAVRGRVVAVGCGNVLDETWEHDGVDWHRVITAVTPPPRLRAGLAYDLARAQVVMFGGDDGSLTPLPDTWCYDANGWRQVITVHAPFGVHEPAMAMDPRRGRVVLHGGDFGYGGPSSDETWEFDGADWTQLSPTGQTLAAQRHAMTFDPNRGAMIACGGVRSVASSSPAPLLANTWQLTPAAVPTWTRYGVGCAGSNGVPVLDAASGSLPVLGGSLQLQFAQLPLSAGLVFVFAGIDIDRWLGQPLPLDLGFVGLPGCRTWIAPDPALGFVVAHAGSTASHAIALPATPALAGQQFALQGVVLDAGVPAGAAVTNAAIAVPF